MTHMRDDFAVDTDRPHTRFSDAGNPDANHALGRPAFEKRQGTKSRREVVRGQSRGYGDLAAVTVWRGVGKSSRSIWLDTRLRRRRNHAAADWTIRVPAE